LNPDPNLSKYWRQLFFPFSDYVAEISARWQQCLQPGVRQVQQSLYQIQAAPSRNLFVARKKGRYYLK
jgi:hypothetical protein